MVKLAFSGMLATLLVLGSGAAMAQTQVEVNGRTYTIDYTADGEEAGTGIDRLLNPVDEPVTENWWDTANQPADGTATSTSVDSVEGDLFAYSQNAPSGGTGFVFTASAGAGQIFGDSEASGTPVTFAAVVPEIDGASLTNGILVLFAIGLWLTLRSRATKSGQLEA